GRNLDQAQQVAFAIPAAPDKAGAFFLVGEFGCIAWNSGYREGGGSAGLEKCSAVHGPAFSSKWSQTQALNSAYGWRILKPPPPDRGPSRSAAAELAKRLRNARDHLDQIGRAHV